MKLTKEEFDNFKPLNNNVLIHIEVENDKYDFGNGHELFLIKDFNRADHTQVIGFVKRVPDRLYYSREKSKEAYSMPWKTDLEVMEGDRVWINYFAVMSALGHADNLDTQCYEYNDDVFILIPYHELVCAEDNDGILIPLNGHCIIELIEQDLYNKSKLVLEIPEVYTKKQSKRIAKVIAKGMPNSDYRDRNNLNLKTGIGGDLNTEPNVAVGDYVILEDNQYRKIEDSMFAKLSDGNLGKVQYRNIMGIIPAEIATDYIKVSKPKPTNKALEFMKQMRPQS